MPSLTHRVLQFGSLAAPTARLHNSYNKKPNKMQQCIKILLFLILNEAEHVSDDPPPIIRSLKLHIEPLALHTWKVVGRAVVGRCQVAYATWQRPTSNIYAQILLIFHQFPKKKTRQNSLQANTRSVLDETLTVPIIRIELVQTGSDSFRPVKHSRSAMATERNGDLTETFLSVWTYSFKYPWEKFTKRKPDV